MRTIPLMAPLKMPPPPPPVQPKVITDLEQLFFNPFIKCVVDNNLSVLVVAGKPDINMLYATWMSLLSQYYELMGSKEAAEYVKKAAKMELLNAKITHVSTVVGAMWSLHPTNQANMMQQLADILREWGYSKAFLPESIAKDLTSVSRELSNSRLKLGQMRLAYENEEEKKGKKEQSAKKEDWVKVLHAIEAHKKMVFDRSKLSMYDFALYQKELQEHNAFITSQTRNNGRR